MGALAGLLAAAGHEVRGSDEDIYPPMSTQLEAAGIPWVRGFRPENLDWQPDRVVVGNVCGRNHVEVVAAQERGLPLESFPSMLAATLLPGRQSVVVAGTHGKTTTASALAWLLRQGGLDPSFFIGGVPVNVGRGYHLGGGSLFVVEGDEYDTAFFDKGSKFLHYRPGRAVLTNVEFDHADIFADLEAVRAAFRAFVATIDAAGELLVNQEDAEAMGIAADAPCRVLTYRVLAERRNADVDTADYCATTLARSGARRTAFEVFEKGVSLGEFSTPLLGRHNVSNLLAAIATARRLGIEPEALRRATQIFRGVRRRQELLGVAQGVRVLEDFAHHPTACALTTSAIRRRYPDKALHVCFEPRSASSRRQRFLEAYASSFDAATEVHIGPLFRPDKVPVEERLDVNALVSAVRRRGVAAHAYTDVDSLLAALVERVVPGDTVLVLSSGSFGGLPRRLLFALGDPVTLAESEDRLGIDALLRSYGLPEIERTGNVETLVVRTPSGIAGEVSLEASDESALLFGLAVSPDRRGEGLGWVLGDSVLRHARTLGVSVVYLFTSTAADFFATKLGFRQLASEAVDPGVRSMVNFAASAALDGAVCMVLELQPEGPLPMNAG